MNAPNELRPPFCPQHRPLCFCVPIGFTQARFRVTFLYPLLAVFLPASYNKNTSCMFILPTGLLALGLPAPALWLSTSQFPDPAHVPQAPKDGTSMLSALCLFEYRKRKMEDAHAMHTFKHIFIFNGNACVNPYASCLFKGFYAQALFLTRRRSPSGLRVKKCIGVGRSTTDHSYFRTRCASVVFMVKSACV